jgi:hypothetical protein
VSSLNRFRPLVLFLGCSIFAGAYSYFAIRGYRAFVLCARVDKASLERAIALERRDAYPYNLLCRYVRDNQGEPHNALPYCEKATQLDRYDAAYWLDLAETSYQAEDPTGLREAVERAVSVDPKTPQVAWNAANLYLLGGEVDPAVKLFGLVLNGDPGLVPLALKSCWQVLGNVNPILRMLPPDPGVYLQFIALLDAENQPEAAAQVWSRLMALNVTVNYPDALFYVDKLLVWRNVAGAERAWEQLAERSKGFDVYQRHDQNLVVNGSFENKVLSSGFGWRLYPQGTTMEPDEDTAKDGHRSLLVTYSVPVFEAGLSQLVPVEPDTGYTASAWIRTEDLQTANGPRLTVTDGNTGAIVGASEPSSYTTDWRKVELQFHTGRDTKLVAVRLFRDRQDTVIRGRLWIDDVQIHKLDNSDKAGH